MDDVRHPDHPAGYIADPGLVDAVNTALVLGRPLLLTGRPGTGKSELAERVAWEFGLGAVLRFEAQSLTEAQDLFYRFDLFMKYDRLQLLAFVPAVWAVNLLFSWFWLRHFRQGPVEWLWRQFTLRASGTSLKDTSR